MNGIFTFIDHTFGELEYSSSEGEKSVENGATEKVE
jgi:hypothetical protein